ncbi:hypothetical protein ACLOJK_040033 [Asimina triloba]
MEWREKLVNISKVFSPQKGQETAFEAELIGVEELAEVYTKTMEEVIKSSSGLTKAFGGIGDRKAKVFGQGDKGLVMGNGSPKRIAPIKGPDVRNLEKIAMARGWEQARSRAKMVKHKVVSVDRAKTSTDRDSKEIFKQSMILKFEHRVGLNKVINPLFGSNTLKILEYMLPAESMIIHENAALSLGPELDNEGRSHAYLKLQQRLLDA